MQTNFPRELLADPAMQASEAILRKCVHCGFCTATCPTYVLLGDELDSPRGRIYLMKEMLENERDPTAEVVKHIDRCLSCLSCMTTCPSGVNYMHLVDHARAYIEERYRRPWHERFFRTLLAAVLPYPRRFRFALGLARLARPLVPVFEKFSSLQPLAAMLSLAPEKSQPLPSSLPSSGPGQRGTVAILQGCAEPVLRPTTREATVRVLERLGYKVVFAPKERCCGALVHHMGRNDAALDAAKANVDAWSMRIDGNEIDAVIVTTSGCGTTIKDYGFMLRNDPDYSERAAAVSMKAVDISEFLDRCEIPDGDGRDITVAYHAACSLQHGQKITEAPYRLLAKAGYKVCTPAEPHLCCGSAGTYNILQPAIAGQLAKRKVENIERLDVDLIAAGNIGCIMQIGNHSEVPIVHTVELLDWAMGGPKPPGLEHI